MAGTGMSSEFRVEALTKSPGRFAIMVEDGSNSPESAMTIVWQSGLKDRLTVNGSEVPLPWQNFSGVRTWEFSFAVAGRAHSWKVAVKTSGMIKPKLNYVKILVDGRLLHGEPGQVNWVGRLLTPATHRVPVPRRAGMSG